MYSLISQTYVAPPLLSSACAADKCCVWDWIQKDLVAIFCIPPIRLVLHWLARLFALDSTMPGLGSRAISLVELMEGEDIKAESLILIATERRQHCPQP